VQYRFTGDWSAAHLSGAIKDDTKTEWLEKFNMSVKHDQIAAIQKIFGTPDCEL
jgi:hypothetical protein